MRKPDCRLYAPVSFAAVMLRGTTTTEHGLCRITRSVAVIRIMYCCIQQLRNRNYCPAAG
jgi:hypothetical protein